MLAPFVGKTDVFFDLDHTLWDFEKNSALAFERVIHRLDLPFEIQSFLDHYVAINEAYWHRYSLNQISQAQLRLGRLQDTFKALDFQAQPQLLEEVSRLYLQYLPEFNHLFPGAVELLRYLDNKYQLHVITNGFHEVQHKKMQHSNLSAFFKTVTNSENAGVKKPDPQIFNFALNLANTTAKRSIMIGDNLVADIQGAQEVGMETVYFNEHQKAVNPDLIQVHQLIDIKQLL